MSKHKRDRMRDYEILYDLPSGEYSETQVGGIRTRTIRAGDTIEVECYPICRVEFEARRERQRRRSTRAQDNLNLRRARDKVRRLLEHNFGPGDIWMTLTYDYSLANDRGMVNLDDELRRWEANGLPTDEKRAKKDFRNFTNKVNRLLKKSGVDAELKWLEVMEVTHEPKDTDPRPLPPHYHFHVVIHAPGLSLEALEACWPHGFVKLARVEKSDGGLAGIANYITKSRGTAKSNGRGGVIRRWSRSKNVVDPPETVSDRKISRRRAAMVARDVEKNGAQIFEEIYKGYRCVDEVRVVYSDFAPGAWIYARMRKRD